MAQSDIEVLQDTCDEYALKIKELEEKLDQLANNGELMKNIISSDLYPKQRGGKECKKTECERYEDYKSWQCGTGSLNFCMSCKNAHVSQFKKKPKE